jgi:RecA/RadA recombinase
MLKKAAITESNFMAKKSNIEQLEDAVAAMPSTTALSSPDLSLGCDVMDLHVSGQIGKSVSPGMFVWLHGDSGSGKSFHAKMLMAEAANSPLYADHRCVIFDGENGSNFNCEKFFGSKLAAKLEAMEAKSLDHLYDALDEIIKTPSVIVVDSFEAWLPASAIKKIGDDSKKRAEDKDPDGSYAMEHGKIHSNRLRLLVPKLVKTNSILIGISQHRDNVQKANPYSPKDVVPGGRAIKFWAHVELETKLKTKIEREINGKKVQIGDDVSVKVHKNRVNGMKLIFDEEFYPTHGIDNIGSSLKWLVDNKYITGGRYKIPELFGEKTYYREELISRIEAEDKEAQLQDLLTASFTDYMSQMQVIRKNRYE